MSVKKVDSLKVCQFYFSWVDLWFHGKTSLISTSVVVADY